MKKVKKVKDSIKILSIGTDHRNYVGLDFDFKEGEKYITKKILSEISSKNIINAVVQIKIKIWENDLDRLSLKKINDSLEDAFYVRPIIPIINRLGAVKENDIGIDLSPEEAINKFIDKYHPESKNSILEKALEIIGGGF